MSEDVPADLGVDEAGADGHSRLKVLAFLALLAGAAAAVAAVARRKFS